MALLDIPNELLLLIAEHLPLHYLTHFSSTNRRLSNLLTTRLYSLAIQDQCKFSALHWAAIKDHAPLAELAISNGAGVNEPYLWYLSFRDYGRTPLYLAIMYDSPEVVRVLVKQGAQIAPTGADGARGHASIANLNETDTPLHIAAKYGATRAIRALLELGAATDMTRYDQNGRMPAHLAARCGRVPSIRAFLEAGFDISLQTSDGNTVLHHALGRTEMMKYLLGRGGGGGGAEIVNVQNNQGNTALHLAVISNIEWEDEGPVRLLLDNGADVDVQNKEGYTPLDCRVKFG